jgi:putative PEP-CTERM system histidine kinase
LLSLAGWGHVVVVLAYGALAAASLRAGASSPNARNAGFLGFTAAVIASVAWGMAGVVAEATGSSAAALGADALDLARYAAWFVFAFVLLWPAARDRRARRWLLLGIAAVALLAATILVVVAGAADGGHEGERLPGPPLASLALPVLGLLLVEQLFRGTHADAHWQAKPLYLGLACLFLFDVYLHSHALLFGRFDADTLAARGPAHAVAALLLWVALQRRTDWTRSLQLSRDAAFHTATLMLVGAYLMVLSGVGYYARHWAGDIGGVLELALVGTGLVLLATLLFSGTVRAKLRVFVGKNFFRYRYDYRTEWLRFTSRLASAGSPQAVGEQAVRGLAELMHSPAGALWSLDAAGAEFAQTARWNAPRSADTEPAASAFARFIGEREWVVDLDECRAAPQRHAPMQLPAWLAQQPNYWIVVPLLVAEQLTGFVVIERPHARVPLNWEVRDLLKTAGRQAAGFLALMQTTDALLEARKFEAFNKMSAFVVHDLKNIVAQLSLMMQNAPRLKDNPEFREDMLTTVDNALAKMRRLMLQLRSGETPAEPAHGVALPRVIERIGAAAHARGRELDVSIEGSFAIRGHENRIERILGHIVDNAFDATPESGSVSVALTREDGFAKVTVRDTGHGMTPEFVNTKLFKPFNSTKANGMGIGTYESRVYLDEIGGSLSVDSAPGRGTAITVRLPLVAGEATPSP